MKSDPSWSHFPKAHCLVNNILAQGFCGIFFYSNHNIHGSADLVGSRLRLWGLFHMGNTDEPASESFQEKRDIKYKAEKQVKNIITFVLCSYTHDRINSLEFFYCLSSDGKTSSSRQSIWSSTWSIEFLQHLALWGWAPCCSQWSSRSALWYCELLHRNWLPL